MTVITCHYLKYSSSLAGRGGGEGGGPEAEMVRGLKVRVYEKVVF